MNKEQINKLLDLYEAGLSSTQDEARLRQELADEKEGSNVWFSFIRHHQKTTPEGLETEIWNSIEKSGKRKNRHLINVLSIAASIVFVITILFSTNFKRQKEMSLEEKTAKLQEALLMFENATETVSHREVLYEDDLLIIYRL